MGAPHFTQHNVHESRARVNQSFNGLLGQETSFELLVALAEQLAVGSRRALRLANKTGRRLRSGHGALQLVVGSASSIKSVSLTPISIG